MLPVMDTIALQHHAEQASALLKAMANERRLVILCSLAQNEMSVGELEAVVGLSQSALSQHLARLRKDELVKTRRSAQTIYYSIRDDAVLSVLKSLHGIYCDGRRSIGETEERMAAE